MRLTEQLEEDETLLQYLSMNLAVQKYVQTDGEALLLAIGTYVGHLKAGRQKQAAAYVEYCQGKSQLRNVNYTMPNAEARQYAMNLYKLEVYMGHTTAFTSKWIKEKLIGVYGGVSDQLHVKDGEFNDFMI